MVKEMPARAEESTTLPTLHCAVPSCSNAVFLSNYSSTHNALSQTARDLRSYLHLTTSRAH